VLDTYGGFLQLTDQIMDAVLRTRVEVYAYVPRGGKAMSADKLHMNPIGEIGAAEPKPSDLDAVNYVENQRKDTGNDIEGRWLGKGLEADEQGHGEAGPRRHTPPTPRRLAQHSQLPLHKDSCAHGATNGITEVLGQGVIPLALLLAAAATWTFNIGGVQATAMYIADVDFRFDKTIVWIPGEEVTTTYTAAGGKLKLNLTIPRGVPLVGGRSVSYELELPPGAGNAARLELAPGVELRIYANVKIRAAITAAGAAAFNTTFYAVPTVQAELVAPGITITLVEKELDKRAMEPSITKSVAYSTPLLAVAASAAVLAFLALWRRRKWAVL